MNCTKRFALNDLRDRQQNRRGRWTIDALTGQMDFQVSDYPTYQDLQACSPFGRAAVYESHSIWREILEI